MIFDDLTDDEKLSTNEQKAWDKWFYSDSPPLTDVENQARRMQRMDYSKKHIANYLLKHGYLNENK